MSTDKLADTIYGAMPGDFCDVPADHLAKVHLMSAAARVREAFVVIDRNDLPKVGRTEHSNWWLVEGNPTMLNTDGFPTVRAQALAALAAAEYMDTHPPVDEKAVAELTAFLDHEGLSMPNDGLARRMVKAGWTKP